MEEPSLSKLTIWSVLLSEERILVGTGVIGVTFSFHLLNIPESTSVGITFVRIEHM